MNVVYHKGSRIEIYLNEDGITYRYLVPGSRIQGTGQRSAEEAEADAKERIDRADAGIKRTLEWPDSA